MHLSTDCSFPVLFFVKINVYLCDFADLMLQRMCYELQHPVYSVPVIQQDLRQEETIHQIADALDYLDQVVNDIFDRVQSRIEESKAKLEKLRKRESLAKLKVEKLTGSSKATKVNLYVLLCPAIRKFPNFSINTTPAM